MSPFTDNMPTSATVLKAVDGEGFSSKSYQANVSEVNEKFIIFNFFHLIALLLGSKAAGARRVTHKHKIDNINKLPEFPKMPLRVT